ncbi:MAG: DUF4348 domain-containing protein [Phocaeicola vulgatus]
MVRCPSRYLPRENLTNVNYGQNENAKSNTKVIEMKGFGNGFNNTLYFERRHGLWKLGCSLRI